MFFFRCSCPSFSQCPTAEVLLLGLQHLQTPVFLEPGMLCPDCVTRGRSPFPTPPNLASPTPSVLPHAPLSGQLSPLSLPAISSLSRTMIEGQLPPPYPPFSLPPQSHRPFSFHIHSLSFSLTTHSLVPIVIPAQSSPVTFHTESQQIPALLFPLREVARTEGAVRVQVPFSLQDCSQTEKQLAFFSANPSVSIKGFCYLSQAYDMTWHGL